MTRIVIQINEQKKAVILIEASVEDGKTTVTAREKIVTLILKSMIDVAITTVLKMMPGIGKEISASDAETLKGLDEIDL